MAQEPNAATTPSLFGNSLPELFQNLSKRICASSLAYVVGIFLLCVFELAEVRLAQAWEHTVAPLPQGTKIAPERQTIVPNPDGLRWIVFTQKSIEDDTVFIARTVYNEGSASGHFTGWSSLPMWWLKLLAWGKHVVTGQPLLQAVPDMAIYYNNVLWVVAAFLMGPMLISAYGWRGAFVIPLMASVLSPLYYSNRYGIFSPDHHLWILLAALGTVVCLSAPFVKENVRRPLWWFLGGAVFVAVGLWLSSASEALILIGVFLGFLFIPSDVAKRVDSANWRWFGYTASLLTMAFCWMDNGWVVPYGLEYNNPIYAAGACVAGLWFWQAHEFAASGRVWRSINFRVLVYSVLVLLLVALPAILYIDECFYMADSFFVRWLSLVAESRPMDIRQFVQEYMILILAILAAAVSWVVTKNRRSRLAFVFSAGIIVLCGILSLSQKRFLDCVLMGVCLQMILLSGWKRDNLAAFLCGILLLFTGFASWNSERFLIDRVEKGEILGNIHLFETARNESERLLWLAGPGGNLMGTPECNNPINYFSKKPVYGTNYWQNQNAIFETEQIFFYKPPYWDPSWDLVRVKILRKGVSHILVPKDFDYKDSYALYGADLIRDPQRTFAYYLINEKPDGFVPWLKLISDDGVFRLFEVR